MVDLISTILNCYCDNCETSNIGKCAMQQKCFSAKYIREASYDGIKSWLNSFNTDSATVCFTAIQELKKAVSEDG